MLDNDNPILQLRSPFFAVFKILMYYKCTNNERYIEIMYVFFKICCEDMNLILIKLLNYYNVS